MLAAWHVLCSLYVWREILVPAPLASAGLEAPCTAEVNTAKSASGKTWQDFLGGYGVSNLRPGCGDPLYQSLEGRERQAMAEDRPSSVGSCDGYPEQKEGDASVFMEEARQPGFLEDDRLDTFINELVDRVRQLRATDVRVARDLAVVVGTHIRRGMTSRLPSLRQASARMLPIQEAWFAAMRHLVNVHTNENGEWAWDWWARLRVACRAASRRYKRRRLMNQMVELDSEEDEERDRDRLPRDDEQGMEVASSSTPGSE